MQSYNYSNLSNGKVFPQNYYDKLKQETNYSCQGSCCTCKYTHRRTEYDKIQEQLYQDNQSSLKINTSIFPLMKTNYYSGNNKHVGV